MRKRPFGLSLLFLFLFLLFVFNLNKAWHHTYQRGATFGLVGCTGACCGGTAGPAVAHAGVFYRQLLLHSLPGTLFLIVIRDLDLVTG